MIFQPVQCQHLESNWWQATDKNTVAFRWTRKSYFMIRTLKIIILLPSVTLRFKFQLWEVF